MCYLPTDTGTEARSVPSEVPTHTFVPSPTIAAIDTEYVPDSEMRYPFTGAVSQTLSRHRNARDDVPSRIFSTSVSSPTTVSASAGRMVTVKTVLATSAEFALNGSKSNRKSSILITPSLSVRGNSL
jgi:hypothetical protein